MEPLVSIIVPVYNLEGYVTNCLNSLVNQTYRNLEILCIDDGSTDKSADVIKAFAEKDDRVIYLYKENGGVSSARNMGLDMFKGEYVMFVDGDDYLHPQAVELFTECILKTNCDIVCSDMNKTTDIGQDFSTIEDHIFRKISFSELCVNGETRLSSSACAKLYKRKFVYYCRFPLNIYYGEDTNFVFKVFSQEPAVVKIDRGLYCYFTREGSAETSAFSLKKSTVIESYDDICDFYLSRPDSEAKIFALKYIFNTIFYNRTLCIGTINEDVVLNKCKSIGEKWLKPFLSNKSIGFKDKIINWVFFHSRHLYELARLIQDPTMLDFYKNRRKHNGKSQKD